MATKQKLITATAVAGVLRSSGISVEAVTAALKELDEAAKAGKKPEPKKPPTPISRQDQVVKAAPGVHRVSGSVGLYLRKGEDSAGAWFRRYWFAGKRHEMGFGPIKRVTLEEAKKKARSFDTALYDDGKDPLELKRAEKAKSQPMMTTSDRWDFITATHEYLKVYK
jgi:hypothetical protein